MHWDRLMDGQRAQEEPGDVGTVEALLREDVFAWV